MKRFDYFVIFFLVVLLGLILLLVFQGDRVGVQVIAVIPSEGESVGIYGPIGIRFSQPMEQASVESRFKLSPEVAGRFEWAESLLWFFPDSALDPDQTYQLELSAGIESANGRKLLETLTWSVTVQQPDILYLVLDEGGGDLWRWDSGDATTLALTNTGGKIVDFSPNRTGDRITYVAENEEGGSDLWLVDRDGSENMQLLSCGMDYCSQPDWSKDGIWIAYSRQVYDPNTGRRTASRIWTVNVETQETTSLYQSEDILGQLPSFSPDGQKIASYDPVLAGIRVLDLETSQETLISTSSEEMGDWSIDGNRLLFIDLIPSALEPEVMIYIADLENGTIRQALNADTESTSFSQPGWSPDENWIAVSLRPTNSTINKALWIFSVDGNETIPVATEPSANFSSYQWDPLGKRLVYQRFGSNQVASIWVWDMRTGESQLILDNAARPQWLP